MIDKFLSYLGQKQDIIIDPNYRPEQAVIGKELINSHQSRLMVLFPPWHGGGWFYARLIDRLSKKGWAVLAYRFNAQILEAEDKAVIESFRHIKRVIVADLETLPAARYHEIRLVGLSLGNVALAMVADGFAKFNSATIVVGGDDLAVDSWHSIRAIDIRRRFEREHIGITKLGKDWECIAPKNHVKNFLGKPVKLVISSRDRIILTKYQYSLARAIEAAGGFVSIKKSRVGHIPTTILFCLFGRLI